MSAVPEPTEPEVTTSEPAAPDIEAHPHLQPVPTPSEPLETPSEETAAQNDNEQRSGEHQDDDEPANSWTGSLHGLLARINPPDLWNEDRPALAKQLNYARYTEQLPRKGLVRNLAIGYTAVAGAFNARDDTKTWIRERPARALVFTVLLVLAALFPPTRALLTVLLTPTHFVVELITNY